MKKKVPEKIKLILEQVKKSLKELYGDQLKGIILYGSYARGDAQEGSDLDLIVLLKNLDRPSREILKCSRKLDDLELNNDIVISVLPFEAREFQKRSLPVILNAKREGIRV